MVLILSTQTASSALAGGTNALLHFPDDYYKTEGSPDIALSLERSRAYQDEETSLFVVAINRGSIHSIKVNNDPDLSRPEEVNAARMELDLERDRTTAQELSITIHAPADDPPLEIKREVALAGNLREGQVSAPLEFPVEVYENAPPGRYTLFAVVNYTYQRDVAVEGKSDRPSNPDIFYLYESESKTIPVDLTIERKSGVQFGVHSLSTSPLRVGSNDNVLRVTVENTGSDTAKDLVARLRPESGIYVSVDESPVPSLQPGETAELVYKVDVSRDAVAGKRYALKLLFEFSDSFREDLSDSDTVYIKLEPAAFPWTLIVLVILAVVAVSGATVRKLKSGR